MHRFWPAEEVRWRDPEGPLVQVVALLRRRPAGRLARLAMACAQAWSRVEVRRAVSGTKPRWV